MQFFWLPSFIAENSAPPREWPQVTPTFSMDDLPAEDSAVILDIRCEADAERASDLLEGCARPMPVWIYDPAATVSSSVAWMKSGAAHVVIGVDDEQLSAALSDIDSPASGGKEYRT